MNRQVEIWLTVLDVHSSRRKTYEGGEERKGLYLIFVIGWSYSLLFQEVPYSLVDVYNMQEKLHSSCQIAFCHMNMLTNSFP